LRESRLGAQLTRQANNFGFLRLLFATLVILAHSPELVDGNRSREILTRLFGTMSLGEVAVDGFFLISGYLILQSLVNSRSNFEYLCKRALRIYPGYITAFVISLWIGTLAGGRIAGPVQTLLDVTRALSLHTPRLDGAFSGNPIAVVNGPMWTVSYEFRCYLLAMLLGVLGILRNRRAYLLLMVALLLSVISQLDLRWSPTMVALFGQARFSEHFSFAFLIGGAFYLFRDRISYTGRAAVLALILLIPLMFFPLAAETALVTLGGYVLFYFAFKFKSARLNRVGSKVDLSYGIYLYAWPIQNLLIWHYRHISPWILFALSATMAGVCAYASWIFVESPALSLKGRFLRHVPDQRERPATAV
jgi:peptidoglycan/LPS O-acetylase OafA/YrhL